MKLYLLTGIGATDYMFKNLRFPAGLETEYLPWFENEPDDTLSSYAQKMIDRYKMQEGQMILGLSLGGIMASEIQKLLPQRKLILISTISHVGQLPHFYHSKLLFMAFERFVKKKDVIAEALIKMPFEPVHHDLDIEEVKRNVRNTSVQHILWVCRSVLHWDQKTPHNNIFHIHGTSDRVFPAKNVECDVKIEGGGHLMILDRAAEINQYLLEELK